MKKTLALMVLMLASTRVHAQPSATPSPEIKGEPRVSLLKEKVLPTLLDPSNGAAAPSDKPQFTFTATPGDTEASAKIGVVWRDFTLDGKVAGPVSKSKPNSNLADITGLPAGAKAELGVNLVLWTPRGDAVKQQEACDAYRDSLRLGRTRTCTRLDLPKGSKYRKDFDDAVDFGTPVFIGGRFKGGRTKFDYFESGQMGSVEQNNWSAVAAVGVLLPSNVFVQGLVTSRSSYKAGDERTFCSPVAGAASSVVCDDLQDGSPTHSTDTFGQLAIRAALSEKLAIYPRLTFGKAQGLDVPVYFFTSKESGLNGGVQFSVRSDHKGPSVFVFVGTLLKIGEVP